ncbi:hypothetical protein [Rickettsia asiatica]|uniref:hypothetical protein n=1 Tax=Rickettsia asiatica TaxID=238800 RepID=UPI0038CD7E37
MGKALEFNDTLKYLSLNDNKIGVIGAKAIAEGLKVNKSLTYLDLGSDCHWGNE